MDPKMDSGMGEPVYTLDEQLEMNSLPLDSSLSQSQILTLMDQLLNCEVTWYSGYSLAQTILTCLYAHRPSIVTTPWLQSYIKGVLETCGFIRDIILRARIFEEEDFQTPLFGLDLGPVSIPPSKKKKPSDKDESTKDDTKATSALLIEAEEFLMKSIKHFKDGAPDGSIESLEIGEALLARIKFCRSFLLVATNACRAAVTIAPSQVTAADTSKKKFDLRKKVIAALQTCNKAIKIGISQIPLISASSGLNSPLPDGIFQPKVGRRLQGHTPTRVIPIMSTENSLEFLGKLLNNLSEISNFVTFSEFTENFEEEPELHFSLPNILHFFSQMSSKNPDIIYRSLSMILFTSTAGKKIMGTIPISKIVKESMINFEIPKKQIQRCHCCCFC
eukprot:TRINITY_DN6036_c0_g1_i2.p1 TRINITY_DN6036_c0_g1~~TRINITY_DN6036_c0_g1_i2.p1  ORF type:complete len:443 (+),score=100.15 TRINITY_DN6036_c0_g1_i2:162-1331(+)